MIGYGLPAWLPDDYLNAEETRALGEFEYGVRGVCSFCGRHGITEGAHVVRKGAGGKPKGTTGPRVVLCVLCHDDVDDHANRCLAVRRDGRPVMLTHSAGVVTEWELHV